MKNQLLSWLARPILVFLCCFVFADSAPAADTTRTDQPTTQPQRLAIDVAHPGAAVSPLFYGLMTEEINHSYDGGLYAEQIQNRIFKDDPDRPVHWSVVTTGNATASIALDKSDPINTVALDTSLKLDFDAIGANYYAGVANDGYHGMGVLPHTKYRLSFYAKASSQLSLTASLQSADGGTTFASQNIVWIGPKWQKFDAVLTTGDIQPTADARFVLTTSGRGTLWLNLVSLFPPTFNDRPNGNRPDLMKLMADLHPAFLRFPGGNYLEGDTIPERFEWKNTIGPLENRPGHHGPWGYRSSDGMGLLEFLQWCEDLHVQPLLAVYAGYSLKHQHVQAGADLQPFVDDALDEIEYCTGDASTKWGRQRADDGHTEPFKIDYVEVGNEDFFDGPNGNYEQRFAQFYDAIKARYPNIQIIATRPVKSRRPDVVDDHYYRSSRATERDVDHYDKSDRNGPKIFVGEWATTEGSPTPNFGAALADAAWLTGLEHNSDLVIMNCYAPLLVNVDPSHRQWGTNLIGYDAVASFGSTSYYAQAMFNQNIGDTILPVALSGIKPEKTGAATPLTGAVGVGTWDTQVQFKDFKITRGSKTLLASDFSAGIKGWRPRGGDWTATDGTLAQNSTEENLSRITAGDPKWNDYTYSFKARKIGGTEGFIAFVHVRGRNDYISWNIGGWGNSKTLLEKHTDNDTVPLGPETPQTVEPNRWYEVRIELAGADIKCFLDGRLITEAHDPGTPPLDPIYASATRVDSTGEVILKVVNVSAQAKNVEIDLDGAKQVSSSAKLIEMTGEPEDVNSLAEPRKIAPRESTVTNGGASFAHDFPAHSISVLRLMPDK